MAAVKQNGKDRDQESRACRRCRRDAVCVFAFPIKRIYRFSFLHRKSFAKTERWTVDVHAIPTDNGGIMKADSKVASSRQHSGLAAGGSGSRAAKWQGGAKRLAAFLLDSRIGLRVLSRARVEALVFAHDCLKSDKEARSKAASLPTSPDVQQIVRW